MKTPKLTTREQMDSMAEKEPIAKSTIGGVVVAMMRTGELISRDAIVAALQDAADEKRTDADVGEMMAKGALRFIATLPQA